MPSLNRTQALHGIQLCLRMAITGKQAFSQVAVGGAMAPDSLSNCLNYRYHLFAPDFLTGEFIMGHTFGEIADEIVRLGGRVQSSVED